MASGMKQWIVVTLLGLALVAVWRLPPEPLDFGDRTVRTAEQLRWDALWNEANTTSEVLFRMMWADSLSALAVTDEEDGVALLTPPLEGAEMAQARRLGERIRAQVRERAGAEPDVVFGYVLQPHDHRAEDGARSRYTRTETYAGTRDGQAYCLQVRVFQRGDVQQALAYRLAGTPKTAPYTDELGPCRFHLSYGLAGAPIQAWLEAGGLQLALEGAGDPPVGPDGLPLRAPGRRGLFGYGYLVTRSTGTTATDRCLAGIESACALYFDDVEASGVLPDHRREIVHRSPASGLGFGTPRTPIRDQAYILAELEAEFGAEAFRAFWTSEEGPGDAFETAFGVSPGAWMVGRIDRLQGIDPPGPGLPHHAGTGSMLTVGLLLGIAWLRRRERSVLG